MADESNAYAMVIAGLKRKRNEIDKTIRQLEGLKADLTASLSSAVSDEGGTPTAASIVATVGKPYRGMRVSQATRKLLLSHGEMMRASEIVESLEAGGLKLKGKKKVSTLSAALYHRRKTTGDIVNPKRGHWGLKEWYPDQNFEKKPSDQ